MDIKNNSEWEEKLEREQLDISKGFTHAGKFHSDDVFATALLKIINPDIEITRGFVVPDDYDGIVYDIGRGRFDHHQEDRKVRENGVPYAAFGLLWKEFGPILVGEEEAKRYDEKMIEDLDLSDNTGKDNLLAKVISEFNPGWDSKEAEDTAFWKAEAFAEEILKNHIRYVEGLKRGNKIVMEAMEKSDGKILVLPQFVPWKEEVIGSGYQFVIYPSKRGGYNVQGVPVSLEDTTLVTPMPEKWWGQDAEKLVEFTGICDMTFCHANGFLASAKTQEGALKIAQLACDNRIPCV